MYCITGWTLLPMSSLVMNGFRLYTLCPQRQTKGRYCDILIYVILLATCYYLWRLLIACLWRWKGRRALADHVSGVWKFRLKAKKELCFSHGSHSVLIAEICKRSRESLVYGYILYSDLHIRESKMEWKERGAKAQPRGGLFKVNSFNGCWEQRFDNVQKLFFFCVGLC